jgi:serine/threonine protein phosphatase PrpC
MATVTAGTSRKGLRKHNQDIFARLCVGNTVILALADGNGGSGGRELAEIAVRTGLSQLCLGFSYSKDTDVESENHLRRIGIGAMKEAVEQVSRVKELREEWSEAGTTVTLLLLSRKFVSVFWIGDSPAYLFDSGTLTLLTSPLHTLAEKLIQEGGPREILARQPGLSSILMRCVGHDSCEPDARVVARANPGVVLVGSDGVFGYIPKKNLEQIIRDNLSAFSGVQSLSDAIVLTALENGSDDNCTLAVAMDLPGFAPTRRSRRITRLYEWRR